MMIDGANMGIKIHYREIKSLFGGRKRKHFTGKKFEKTCEKLIQDMKKYL